MKETISELMDSRLDTITASEELDRVAGNPETCRIWRDYHLIGAVIRGEVRATGPCVMDRVRKALMDETVEFTRVRAASDGRFLQHGQPDSDHSRGQVLKAAGLFAVAASIALTAVLVLETPGQWKDERALVAGAGQSGAVSVPTSVQQVPAIDESFHAEFGQMLTQHGEFTGTAALNGLASYAKFISNQQLGQ